MNDITIASYYFKDNDFREKNYYKFIKYWSKQPCTLDIEVTDTFIPKMEAYNNIARRCKTKYIAWVDIDVYYDFEIILKSISMLESGYHFISPFSRYFNVYSDGTKEEMIYDERASPYRYDWNFYKKRAAKMGEEPEDSAGWEEHFHWNPPFFVGLTCITTLKTYKDFGMGNENFITWGCEDDEWYARATKLGYKWTNLEENAYHNHHGEKDPDKQQLDLIKLNILEIFKILSLDNEQLRQYISTWKWLKQS